MSWLGKWRPAMIGLHASLLRRGELLLSVLARWLESCDRPVTPTSAFVRSVTR